MQKNWDTGSSESCQQQSTTRKTSIGSFRPKPLLRVKSGPTTAGRNFCLRLNENSPLPALRMIRLSVMYPAPDPASTGIIISASIVNSRAGCSPRAGWCGARSTGRSDVFLQARLLLTTLSATCFSAPWRSWRMHWRPRRRSSSQTSATMRTFRACCKSMRSSSS